MGDNGKAVNPEPQAIKMEIIAEPGKAIQVSFPLLMDEVMTYGFLKMAEKTLDKHYAQAKQTKIVPAKHGIMDFVRRK